MFAAFVIFTILNAAAFVAAAVYIGGDAVNGKAEGGRYYVYGVRGQNGQKAYTQVSPAVFAYSKYHVYVTVTTWFLMFIVGVVKGRPQRPRDAGAGIQPEQAASESTAGASRN